MNASEFRELLDKYAKGECSLEEEKLVLDWYENIGRGQQNKAEEGDKEAIETQLWSKIKPNKGALGPSMRHLYPFARAAAALVVLAIAGAGLFGVFKERSAPGKPDNITNGSSSEGNFAYHENKTKKPSEISLEDGSRVWLMPESGIRVDNSFQAGKREVYLRGGASFKVKHNPDRPFIVYAGEVVTRVLGTTFSIKAYDNEKEITVAVKKGKVSVYASRQAVKGSTQEELILTPNQRVVYDRDKERASKQLVEDPVIILQKPTLLEMTYDEVPVSKILDVLEENYGVEIVYNKKALSQCMLTTSMSDEGFLERIEVICKAIHANYKVLDAVVFIESQGCK